VDSMKLFWGLVVLSFGLVLIGTNQGWISSSIWASIFMLWPILLIVIGLSLIIKNQKVLSVVVLLIMLASTCVVAMTYNRNNSDFVWGNTFMGSRVTGNVVSENLDDKYDKTNMRNLDVKLFTGAAKVKIAALPVGADSDSLYKISTSNMGKLGIKKTIVGDKITLSIEEESVGIRMGTRMMVNREVELLLSPNLLVNLKADSGASKLVLDFTSLNIENTDLNIGASTADITLGTLAARQNMKLSAGASNITFHVPENLGIKAALDSGLSNINSDSALSLAKSGNTYASSGFDSKPTQVTIGGSAGVSNIKFEVK